MKEVDLCLELAYCEDEENVISILSDARLWENQEFWRPYGDDENNFSIIGSQQSRPEYALVEKIINSVDSVLMAECLRRAIDPESSRAPQAIKDALNDYFGIFDGKLSNLSPTQRAELAENIAVVATGQKTKPNYIVIDKGEGQTPAQMPDTLLSLRRSNKLRIPFVQGKFNMGGTGVLQFCGDNNIQLIISKRHPEIANMESDLTRTKWGFTIVRREAPSHGRRSSMFTYLAPGNAILSFEADELPLLPGQYPYPYGSPMKWGTYIKLYNYQMTGFKTLITLDLYYRLSLLMPSIALPVRLYERRKGYSSHSPEITLSGLSVRLVEDRRENLESGFPTSFTVLVRGQNLKGSIFLFKKGQSEKYTKREGIIFTVNGQTQGYLAKSFFKKESVRMGYLSDSLLMVVDCTNLDGRSREDLFMNSRDRLRSNELRAEIENNLEQILKNHKGLREARESRRREAIQEKISDSKPFRDVVESILQSSPTLYKLLVTGQRLSSPFRLKEVGEADEFEGKVFPSYFRLVKEFPKDAPKGCPQNSRFRMEYSTDASNDYFDRDKEPGRFLLFANGKELRNYTLNLWNGRAYLTASLPRGNKADEIIRFESEVIDNSRIWSFRESFYVKVLKQVLREPGKLGKRKKPPSEENGKDLDKPQGLDVPRIIEVRKSDWLLHKFNEKSALRVEANGEGSYDFFVNIDNIHLLTEQKGHSDDSDVRLLTEQYKYGMALIGMALINDKEEKSEAEIEADNEYDDIFERIINVSKSISPFLLPIIRELGSLEFLEQPEMEATDIV